MKVSLHVSEQNSWKVLSLTGRVDAFSDKRVIAQIRETAPDGEHVIVDLSRCEFLSLWALRALSQWADELRTQGRGLVLSKPSDGVLRQLNVFVGNRLPISWDLSRLEVESFYQRSRAEEAAKPAYLP